MTELQAGLIRLCSRSASRQTHPMLTDIRYALRGLRRSPLFAASVAATIGLGLGVLCSAFTVLNAYVFRPIDLPNPSALYSLSWDTAAARRQRFTLEDFETLRDT